MITFLTKSKKIMISCFITIAALIVLLVTIYIIIQFNHKDLKEFEDSFLQEPLPEFNLPLLSDSEEKLIDNTVLNHQVSLINTWSVNCRLCRYEHSLLFDIAKYISNKSINFISINNSNTKEDALLWLEQHGDPYQLNLFDIKNKFGSLLNIGGLPDLLVVDQYGIIQYRYVGLITEHIWEQEIKPVLEHLYY